MNLKIKAILAAFLLTTGLTVLAGTEVGVASYYADSLHGNLTASGDAYDKDAMTAAHRKLPLGTQVIVINLSNQKEVGVRINDRGPRNKSRINDVSGAAARKLDMIDSGTARVRILIED